MPGRTAVLARPGGMKLFRRGGRALDCAGSIGHRVLCRSSRAIYDTCEALGSYGLRILMSLPGKDDCLAARVPLRTSMERSNSAVVRVGGTVQVEIGRPRCAD